MSNWTPLKWQDRPEIMSIIIVTIILFICFLVYYLKLRKLSVKEAPSGYVLMVQIYIEFIRGIVTDILGKKAEKLTPFFIFLMSYLLCCNLLSIFGFEDPTASLSVTLSLGFIMWIGTFVIGFRYQKLSYLTRFCINIKNKKTNKSYPILPNPLNLVEVITPLISISFRLWGNMFAGGVIITLWYFLIGYITSAIPVVGCLSLLIGLISPPIHGYFDIFVGVIQALVFTMLTAVYWSLAKEHGNYNEEELKIVHEEAINSNIINNIN